MSAADLFFLEAGFISNVSITGNTITAERGAIQLAAFLSGFPTYPGGRREIPLNFRLNFKLDLVQACTPCL